MAIRRHYKRPVFRIKPKDLTRDQQRNILKYVSVVGVLALVLPVLVYFVSGEFFGSYDGFRIAFKIQSFTLIPLFLITWMISGELSPLLYFTFPLLVAPTWLPVGLPLFLAFKAGYGDFGAILGAGIGMTVYSFILAVAFQCAKERSRS